MSDQDYQDLECILDKIIHEQIKNLDHVSALKAIVYMTHMRCFQRYSESFRELDINTQLRKAVFEEEHEITQDKYWVNQSFRFDGTTIKEKELTADELGGFLALQHYDNRNNSKGLAESLMTVRLYGRGIDFLITLMEHYLQHGLCQPYQDLQILFVSPDEDCFIDSSELKLFSFLAQVSIASTYIYAENTRFGSKNKVDLGLEGDQKFDYLVAGNIVNDPEVSCIRDFMEACANLTKKGGASIHPSDYPGPEGWQDTALDTKLHKAIGQRREQIGGGQQALVMTQIVDINRHLGRVIT